MLLKENGPQEKIALLLPSPISDKNVFCGSIHQFPLFPGTGSEEEVGAGNIFNAPIPAGTNFKYFMDHLMGSKENIILILVMIMNQLEKKVGFIRIW